MIRRLASLLLLATFLACKQGAVSSPAPSADVRVTQLADAYLAAYFDRNPDQVTVYGVPGRTHERLPDNSLEALTAWRAKEDRWLDRSARHRTLERDDALAQGHPRDSSGNAGRLGRGARVPLRALERQPDDRVAGAVRLSGHDSAGEQRGGAA